MGIRKHLLAAMLSGITAGALAEGYVIGHVTVRVGPDEVREIFLGNMQFAGKQKLVPVDNGAVQGNFLYEVLRVDPDRYAGIWMKKAFREGVSPPPVMMSDAEVKDFVRRTPGGIGYVGSNPGSANIIMKY